MPEKKLSYDCNQCPAYCCSYKRISVSPVDIFRLARHFGLSVESARRRFTKTKEGEQVLRHQKDKYFGTICRFLDSETRRCTVYTVRPGVCREYPEENDCGYYTFLSWEREHQEDPGFVPLTD